MTLTQLARDRWQAFFDGASKTAAGHSTTVEVTGLSLGDRFAADHVRLFGVSYEPRNDTLTLMLEGLEHRISHPKTIHIEHSDDDQLASFQVIDAEDQHHIVQLNPAMPMPKV